MQITQQFDGGNIVALAGSNTDEICLEIGQTTLLSFISGSISAQRRQRLALSDQDSECRWRCLP